MRPHLLWFFVPLTAVVACTAGPSGDDTDTDTTASDDTDDTTGDDTTDDDTTSDDTDATTSDDTDIADAVTAADLAGVFLGNNPTEACLATILSSTVISVVAGDDDTVTLSDGTVSSECEIVGSTLVCAEYAGSTAVPVGETACTWPYTVSLLVDDVSADGFDLEVQFQTATGVGGAACSANLTECLGVGTATFSRWDGQDQPPPPSAAVKASAQ